MEKPGFEVYDVLAEGFIDRAFSATYNRLYDQPVVLDLLPDVSGGHVLDAGCGPGAYFEELLDRGAQVTGIDASPTMLRHARTHYGDRVTLFEHDLSTPLDMLEDNSIDVVICALMIHYLEDPTPMLREFHRLLEPNGHLIVSTQHPVTDWIRKGGSYFDVAIETDIWAHGDRATTVPFWRMPMDRITSHFFESGFWIDGLVEHRPSDTLKKRDPEEFAKLARRPGFVAFRLRPRS